MNRYSTKKDIEMTNKPQKDAIISHWDSLVAQALKNLLPMQETQVRSLGQEDPLEKEMTTHSSILAWEILWTEEPGKLHTSIHGVHKELDMTAQLNNNH